jgi:RHS repeat-associated protein
VQYDPYGNLISNSLPDDLSTYLFTGQRWDEDLDLYDYRARFYDPLTGSFISPDSIIPDPLNPAAWNRFSYGYSNPVKFVDPSGHTPIATMTIGTVLGAVIGLGSYTLSTALSGHEFNIKDALLATTAGAAAGLAIGSGTALIGAGLSSSGSVLIGAGTGALASQGGYLAANAITGAPFSAGDFVIVTGIGAISGAITPFIPGPWSAATLGGAANASRHSTKQP